MAPKLKQVNKSDLRAAKDLQTAVMSWSKMEKYKIDHTFASVPSKAGPKRPKCKKGRY